MMTVIYDRKVSKRTSLKPFIQKKIELSIPFNNEKQRVVSCMHKHNKHEIN